MGPGREPVTGYGERAGKLEQCFTAAFEMPVTCNDHQVEQQQCSEASWILEDELCASELEK